VSAIIAPLVVPWITLRFGWRWAFVFTGALGFAWLGMWLAFYRKPQDHSYCTKNELSYIQSDLRLPPARVKWSRLPQYKQTWAYAIGKLMTDPIWWFYLCWIPDYLQRQHGLHLSQIGLPIVAIYLLSDVGSVGGGWISSSLIHRGFTVNAARKSAMLICALCILPIAVVYRLSGLWPATILIGLAAAGHQGFSANLLTLPSDLFPSRVVASIAGIG
jgi:MFS transporter, ACS family, hexuronate transporter